MATRGRKPTPTAIKELEGNPGKRPLNQNEPKPGKKAPACPKWLESEAKKEWRRLAKSMEQMGVLKTMNDRMTKNYKTDGGDTWVIGGKLIIEEGAEVEGLGEGEGGSYTLPKASADILGGVKIGTGLSVDGNGVLNADGITPAANQAALEATEVADVVTAFNALLTKLKTAGIMTADTEPGE